VGNKRGFSSMDKQKQKEIASKGGKAAHQKGTAHEFTSEEARVAGRKGGAASRARRAGAGGAPSGGEPQAAPEAEQTNGSEPPANP
jgi:general stress protein YciG